MIPFCQAYLCLFASVEICNALHWNSIWLLAKVLVFSEFSIYVNDICMKKMSKAFSNFMHFVWICLCNKRQRTEVFAVMNYGLVLFKMWYLVWIRILFMAAASEKSHANNANSCAKLFRGRLIKASFSCLLDCLHSPKYTNTDGVCAHTKPENI